MYTNLSVYIFELLEIKASLFDMNVSGTDSSQ